jgi:hypothetical protein
LSYKDHLLCMGADSQPCPPFLSEQGLFPSPRSWGVFWPVAPSGTVERTHLSVNPLPVARGLQRQKGAFCWKLKNLTASPYTQACKYQQLFFTDPNGEIISRDIPLVLGRIKCSRTEAAAVLPNDHNQVIMKVLKIFSDEVRHRRAQLQHGLSLTTSQNYVLRELRAFYS